ncbi:MAG: bifunctional oligoribonuclease/PAP phosphatase NrnA [Candidatus Njordarchaeota archaeon]
MCSLTKSREKLINFWRKIVSEKIDTYVIASHENADFDALASTQVFLSILKRAKPEAEAYVLIDKISRKVRDFLEYLDLSYKISRLENTPKSYVLILLDMSDPNRFVSVDMRKISKNALKVYALDHHVTKSIKNVETFYACTSSTVEILLYLAENTDMLDGILEDKNLIYLVAAAILSDTAFFSTASEMTFYYMDKICSRLDYELLVRALKKHKIKDLSEIMAVLKAMQRLIIRKIEDKVVVVTHVGGFESVVANTILQLGADIVFVASKKKEKNTSYYRIIARSRDHNITSILEKIISRIGGTYGVLGEKIGGAQVPYRMKIDKLKKIILKEILNDIYGSS